MSKMESKKNSGHNPLLNMTRMITENKKISHFYYQWKVCFAC